MQRGDKQSTRGASKDRRVVYKQSPSSSLMIAKTAGFRESHDTREPLEDSGRLSTRRLANSDRHLLACARRVVNFASYRVTSYDWNCLLGRSVRVLLRLEHFMLRQIAQLLVLGLLAVWLEVVGEHQLRRARAVHSRGASVSGARHGGRRDRRYLAALQLLLMALLTDEAIGSRVLVCLEADLR